MAVGRPVVATAVDGTPEIVEEGETGYLVPPRDPAALAAALARVLDDPALAARLGARAHRRALERYTWDANARQHGRHLRGAHGRVSGRRAASGRLVAPDLLRAGRAARARGRRPCSGRRAAPGGARRPATTATGSAPRATRARMRA